MKRVSHFRPYLSAFRLRLKMEWSYRSAAIAGILTQVVFGLILCGLYDALLSARDPHLFRETVTYVWLQQLFFRAVLSTDAELSRQIMTGSIVSSMVRPVHLCSYCYVRNLAMKLTGSFMRALPAIPLFLLLPPAYQPLLPASPSALIAFLFSLALGFLVMSAVENICLGVQLHTLDNRGINAIIHLLQEIFCGNIIPLTLFPERFQTFLRLQPFSQALDLPLRLYLGILPVQELPIVLCLQALWALLLYCLSEYLFRHGLRSLVIHGG